MEQKNNFTAEDLKKPLSLAQKTLLSAGGLAILAGVLKPGKVLHDVMTGKEVGKRILDAENKITQKYKQIMNASNQHFTKELADTMNKRKALLDPKYSSIPKDHKKPNALFSPLKRLSDKLNRLVITAKDKADQAMAEKGLDVASVEGRRLLNQVNLNKDRLEELADTASDITAKRKDIGDTLSSRHLKHIDTVLPILGAASLFGTAMTKKASSDLLSSLKEKSKKKAERLNKIYKTNSSEANVGLSKLAAQEVKAETKPSVGATKESEMPSKPYPDQTNLLRIPVNYNKGFQCGPIIENADKMSKIAQAVNNLFPKVPTDPRDKIIEKQTKKLDKKDEAIAMHEQAHQEKDMKLKELTKAIKITNKKLEHFRNKAIENYGQSLDLEAETASGTTR